MRGSLGRWGRWLSAPFQVADSHVFIGPPLPIGGACALRWSEYLIGTSIRSSLDTAPSSKQRERSLSHGVSMALEVIGVNRIEVRLESVLVCPVCGFAKRETMPTDACQIFYECVSCKTLLRPKLARRLLRLLFLRFGEMPANAGRELHQLRNWVNLGFMRLWWHFGQSGNS
jgi:hypothetical protein